MTRKVGTTDEVLAAFIDGREMRTGRASVPGGNRLSAETDYNRPGLFLFSYRTEIALRLEDGCIAVTPKKYSRTTAKQLYALIGELQYHGYDVARYWDIMREMAANSRRKNPREVDLGETVSVRANVPGRWGGYGPAWHPTGYDFLPFMVFRRGAA
jgi:hypothetical protein